MSKHFRGGQKKICFNNNIAMFDIRRFGETLDFNFPESDPSKWGIKKEWREFAKKYFSSARPTERYVKGACDFFHRNKDKITLLVKSIREGNGTESNVGLKNNNFNGTGGDRQQELILPNFTKIINSIVVLNSEGVLGADDSLFEGDTTKTTTPLSPLNYMFENLASVENSIFVVNSENIRLSHLVSNSRPVSSSSVGVDNDKELLLNEVVKKVALGDSHYQPLNSNPKQNKILDESCNNTTEKEDETLYKFSIEKEILVKIDNENWGYHFKEENTLSYNWTKYFADLLSKYFPNCCINFKRREMYPQNSTYIAKFWFYCSIAGCSLDSTAQLFKNRDLIVQNKNTSLSHTKGVYKSFRSRFVRGKDRVKLGKSVSELSFPSKEFHKIWTKILFLLET